MRAILSLVRRFHSDERGVFAVFFGLIAVVLIATAGAVVDFTSIAQARTRAQNALDAAALGLQPTIYTAGVTAATIKTKAETLLAERLNDTGITSALETPLINTTEGTLHLEGTITVPTSFIQLVGISSVKARVVAEATRKRLNLEVVMVLDNSNSMKDYSRMSELKKAAECLTDILFNSDCASTAVNATNDRVWVGMVPFTLQVNVGTGNANAAWMDRTGTVGTHSARTGRSANITNDNFDNDDNDGTVFNGTVDRIALMDQLNGVSWGGCVEARKTPYDTQDDLPVAGTDTMFTPMFAPDEPDSGFSNSYIPDRPASCTNKDLATWTYVQTKYSCNKNANNSKSNYDTATCDGAAPTNTYTQTNDNGQTVTAATTPPASSQNNPASCTETWQTISGSDSNRTNRYTRSCTYQFSNRELQERLCKYTGATVSGINQAQVKGPNGDCPTNAITPLTATKSTVIAAINALAPQGGTNIHAGTMWGFHVLSPTAPFSEGGPYDTATSKVMIVMTDGENTAYQTGNMNNTTYYSHYGMPWNARLGTASSTDAQLETEMNTRLVATCNNAKAAGISIYTVGLSVNQTSAPATNTQMLKDCSSGDGYWYFPTLASELTTVFQDIANQLSKLRLAK